MCICIDSWKGYTSQAGIQRKESVSVVVKPSQVSEKGTMTSKLKFVNASTQTDDKIHVGCHDVATLMEDMFPECPWKHCDPA